MLNQCPRCKEKISLWKIFHAHSWKPLNCQSCEANLYLSAHKHLRFFCYAIVVNLAASLLLKLLFGQTSYLILYFMAIPFSFLVGFILFVKFENADSFDKN